MLRILMAIVLSVLCVTQSQAQTTPSPQNSGTTGVLGDIADIVFKEAEKRIIEEFYDKVPGAGKAGEDDDKDGKHGKDKKDKSAKGKGRGDGLPPGLAKRDQLPPGLARRGNQLPSGLMKGDLPPELDKQLPALPANVERVIVDSDILLVQKGTDLILDVLEGVLRGQ
ncbi:MAG: hypothetical protein WD075_12090 [Rhodospirillales bacterium]